MLTNSRPGSLEKWLWLHHFLPSASLFLGHELGQLEWKPLPGPDPGLSVEVPAARGLLIMHPSLPPPAYSQVLLPRFLIFPGEQQWIGLVCLSLPRRGCFITMGRSLPASCSAKGWVNERQLIQKKKVHPASSSLAFYWLFKVKRGRLRTERISLGAQWPLTDAGDKQEQSPISTGMLVTSFSILETHLTRISPGQGYGISTSPSPTLPWCL